MKKKIYLITSILTIAISCGVSGSSSSSNSYNSTPSVRPNIKPSNPKISMIENFKTSANQVLENIDFFKNYIDDIVILNKLTKMKNSISNLIMNVNENNVESNKNKIVALKNQLNQIKEEHKQKLKLEQKEKEKREKEKKKQILLEKQRETERQENERKEKERQEKLLNDRLEKQKDELAQKQQILLEKETELQNLTNKLNELNSKINNKSAIEIQIKNKQEENDRFYKQLSKYNRAKIEKLKEEIKKLEDKLSTIYQSPNFKESYERKESIIDNVVYNTKKLNPYNHVRNTHNISSEYVEAKNKYAKDNDEPFIYSPPTNDVWIVEADFNKSAKKELENFLGEHKNKVELIPNQNENGDNTHAKFVYISFANKNIAKESFVEFDVHASGVFDFYNPFLYTKTGIINLSLGDSNASKQYYSNLLKDAPYLENISTNIAFLNHKYILSNLILNKNYKNNLQLKIKSMGNSVSNQGQNPINQLSTLYQAMSPELQKMARSEVITVKATVEKDLFNKKFSGFANKRKEIYNVNGKSYYSQSSHSQNDTQGVFLRANTVGAETFIHYIQYNLYRAGSSFSAPKVSRIAYEIKKNIHF